jgi:hypothetical protein
VSHDVASVAVNESIVWCIVENSEVGMTIFRFIILSFFSVLY